MLMADDVSASETNYRPTKPEPKPRVEEISLEAAQKVLNEKGFTRTIQVRRDLRTGKIIDLFLRE
jgi:beta-lactam-binding protein with PASTA domain